MSNVRDHSMPVESVLPASDAEALYQLVKRSDIDPAEVEDLGASAVEVQVLWRSAILHVAHLAPGASFTLTSTDPALPSPSKRMAPGLVAGMGAMVAGAALGAPAAVAGVGVAVAAASLGAGMHAHLRNERSRTDATRFVVDRALLGADEAAVVVHDGGARFVFLPGAQGEIEIDGARRTLAELEAQGLAMPSQRVPGAREVAFVPGGRYRMDVGGITVVAKEVRAGRRVAPTLYRDPVMGRVALGTGVAMAALMGVMHLAAPDAGLLSSEDQDARLSLLRSAVERIRERAQEAPQPEPQQGAAAGRAHEGPAGAMGDRRSTNTGRFTIQRRGPTPQIGRTRAEAQRAGVLSLNFGTQGGATANNAGPTSPFGALVASGNDDRDANGRMDGDHDGDGSGFGGLDGVGTGWGGGGDGRDTIGAGPLGTIGHGGDCREGQDCDRGRRAVMRQMNERRDTFQVAARTPTVSPGISPELIRRVVLRNIGQVNRCYEQGLSTNPRAAGRVAVRFVIAPGGSVLGAAVAEDTVQMPSVAECIAGSVRRWSFAIPADSGTVTVTYPFSLMPADQ